LANQHEVTTRQRIWLTHLAKEDFQIK